MNLSYSNRSLSILPTILILWLLFGVAAISWINPLDMFLALSLLAFTMVISLFNIFRFSGLITTILSLTFYSYYQYSILGSAEKSLNPILIFSIIQIVATLLALAIYHQSKSFSRQLEHDRRTFEDLRIRDPETNLIRYPYAIQSLKTEIARSRRKEEDICILLLQMRGWKTTFENLDIDKIRDLKHELSTLIISNTRVEDTVFINGYYGAILPETNAEEGAIVARRIINQASKSNRLDLCVGIALFPADAVTEQNLIKAAESALENAEKTDNPIYFFSQISFS